VRRSDSGAGTYGAVPSVKAVPDVVVVVYATSVLSSHPKARRPDVARGAGRRAGSAVSSAAARAGVTSLRYNAGGAYTQREHTGVR